MSHIQSALDDIQAARVALKEGRRRLADDLLKDAQDTLWRGMEIQRITVMPNVELCEALEKELAGVKI